MGKDSGAAGDPFAPWRGALEFTVEDAAYLCAGIVPGRAFRFWKDRDKAEQEEVAALNGWRTRIRASAPELGVSVRRVPERHTYSEDILGRPHVTGTKPAHTEYGKVTRAALVEWLDKLGKRPAFFDEAPTESAADALTTRERETLLGLVGVLAELAGLDLTKAGKGHSFAKMLVPQCEARGLKITAQTIATKLCEVPIKPAGPAFARLRKGWIDGLN